MHIFVVYIKPNIVIDDFEKCMVYISNKVSSHDFGDIVLVCGDFNSHIVWTEVDGSLVPTHLCSPKDHILVEAMCDLGLQQFSNVCNLNGNQLDLVFCKRCCSQVR